MQTIVEQFEHHAARAFFASAWADAVEESESPDAPNLSGKEIMSEMPAEIDSAAVHAARTLRCDMERTNGKTIDALMALIVAQGDGDRANTPEMFGHYAAMQAMGHGVGLSDAFGDAIYQSVRVPYCEFGSHSLSRDYF